MLTPLSGCRRFSLGADDFHSGTFILMFVVVLWGVCHRFPVLWIKPSLVPREKNQQPPSVIHPSSRTLPWCYFLNLTPCLQSLWRLVFSAWWNLESSGRCASKHAYKWIILIKCIVLGRPVPWEGTITWRKSYTVKWRKWAEPQHVFIALCFLILDVIWLANSSSWCLHIYAMMNYFWNCESEKNVFSIKSLLLVCFFNHSNRKRNQNNLFLEKAKISLPEESVYLSLYVSRRKTKLTSQEALNYQGYTSDELPNWAVN